MQSFKLWESDTLICMGSSLALKKEMLNKSVTVKDLLKEVISKVKTTSVPRGKGTALNVRTGIQEKIYIDEFSEYELLRDNAEPVEKYAKDVAGKIIGKMRIGHSKDGALEIHDIATSDEYKGIGREMIRKVVEQSKRIWLNGRVQLTAWTGYLPEDYLAIAGKKATDTAAAIKYHKMGFVANDPKLEQEILDTIQSGGTGLRANGTIDNLVGHMHLSEQGIKQFLA